MHGMNSRSWPKKGIPQLFDLSQGALAPLSSGWPLIKEDRFVVYGRASDAETVRAWRCRRPAQGAQAAVDVARTAVCRAVRAGGRMYRGLPGTYPGKRAGRFPASKFRAGRLHLLRRLRRCLRKRHLPQGWAGQTGGLGVAAASSGHAKLPGVFPGGVPDLRRALSGGCHPVSAAFGRRGASRDKSGAVQRLRRVFRALPERGD